MENQENRNNTLRDFLLGLHLINLKLKKPPDKVTIAKQADSAGMVGGPKSR